MYQILCVHFLLASDPSSISYYHFSYSFTNHHLLLHISKLQISFPRVLIDRSAAEAENAISLPTSMHLLQLVELILQFLSSYYFHSAD